LSHPDVWQPALTSLPLSKSVQTARPPQAIKPLVNSPVFKVPGIPRISVKHQGYSSPLPKNIGVMPQPKRTLHTPENNPIVKIKKWPKFGVNLLPHKLAKRDSPDDFWRGFMLWQLTALVLISLGYGGMITAKYYLVQKTQNVQRQIEAVNQEINSYADLQTEVAVLDQRAQAIQGLLSQHIYWTNFFQQLAEYTLPQVNYTSFSGAKDGIISLTATAPDYQSISQQIAVFKNQWSAVQGIYTDSAQSLRSSVNTNTTATEAKIQFTLNLQIDPKILNVIERNDHE